MNSEDKISLSKHVYTYHGNNTLIQGGKPTKSKEKKMEEKKKSKMKNFKASRSPIHRAFVMIAIGQTNI